MISPVQKRMVEVFGGETLGDAKSPWWTRIELDDGDMRQVAASFLRSIDRARTITTAMFARSPHLTAGLTWIEGDNEAFEPPFEQLDFMGLSLDRTPDVVVHCSEDGDEWWVNRHYLVLDNQPDLLAPLMMAAYGGHRFDRLINLSIDLIDFDRGLGLEFYNHKGMTLIATEREALAPIYHRYRDWVRDMELERCDEAFGAAPNASRPGFTVVT